MNVVENLTVIELNEEIFFSKMDNLIDRNKQNKAYDINLIDELHANENAHTRILMKLLSFCRNHTYFILNNFVELLNGKLDSGVKKIENLSNPCFIEQWELIDGYIYSKADNIAIIIENKIQWAEDQDKQIERYIKSAADEKFGNIPIEKIYVVYLTDNGIKKVSDTSLTEKAKEWLGVTENSSGRYIELNYQDDLLPLFKDVLSYLDFSKEIYLKSALIQYIDYLDGRFGFRKRDKEFLDYIICDMMSTFGIDLVQLSNIKMKAELYTKLMNYEEKLTKYDKNKFLQLVTYFNYLHEIVYPKNERPGIVKNYIYNYFLKDKNNQKELNPFDTIYINYNTYPNVILLKNATSSLMMKFPNDDLKDCQDIIFYIPVTSNKLELDNGWIKDKDNRYVKSIPYEDIYKEYVKFRDDNRLREFFKYLYKLINL